MTITSQICKHIYQADGSTRTWELDFPLLSEQELKLYVTDASGTQTQVTQNYAVNLTTGVVTYPTLASGLDPLASGTKVTLLRATAPTQEVTLTQQGRLDAKTLEHAYDKLTLLSQELAECTERCIKYAPSSGKTGADADTFLAELNTQQTQALSAALASVAQTESTLTQNLTAEASSRQSADTSLQQSIQTVSGLLSQEVSNRQGADTSLQSALTAETTARENADTALQTNITAEEAARSSADSTLQANITAEASARTQAVSALQAQVNQLNFIEFVQTLPQSGQAKYIYCVPQENTTRDGYSIVQLFLWDSTAGEFVAVGAFDVDLAPQSLLYTTDKGAANGVAGLDANGKVTAGQIPYATASTVGGVKLSFDETTATLAIMVGE